MSNHVNFTSILFFYYIIMKISALGAIDFYKTDHRRQYPDWTNLVFSNFTPRSDRLFKWGVWYDHKIVVFGLQFFIKEFLIETWDETFFKLPKTQVLTRYKRRMDTSLGKWSISIEHIEKLYDLGYLPIEIRALKEWTRSGIKIPVLTITNTLPEFFWLVNYLETVLSTELWKPMTNATIAYEYRRILTHYADLTWANKDFIPFQGHDFSARGLSNKEDWYKNGQSHLTSFYWTDTVLAIAWVEDYYNWNSETELIWTSVPATEHSVMCMWEQEGELETFRRLITELYPNWIISIVSDTWDFWKVLSEYTVKLKDEILNRWTDSLWNSKVVFRPDSWNPVDIVSWYSNYKHLDWETDIQTNMNIEEFSKLQSKIVITKNWKYYYEGRLLSISEYKGAIETLWNIFWGEINSKWFKTLNSKVWLIYWDSITLERQEAILNRLMLKWFSSDNIVFWIWSYTYQYSTRDTLWFAMKATYWEINWKWVEISKDPKTDRGTKKSAKWLLFVWKNKDWEYYLEERVSKKKVESKENCLEVVFRDWKLIRETSFKEIRERLW